MKTIYKADDGTEFYSKKECEQYEALFRQADFLAVENHYNGMLESGLRDLLLELHEKKLIKIQL
jgi:hypothetical protein